MEIRLTHRFQCAPEAYWNLVWDSSFERDVRAEAEVDFTVLEETVEGPRSRTRTRVSPRRELPVLAAKAIGQTRFSYVQEVEADSDTLTTRWRVISDILTEKIHCAGTSRVIAAPEGCERLIEGAIDVTIPLVGSAVERTIVAEITRSYERAAEVLRRHLNGSA